MEKKENNLKRLKIWEAKDRLELVKYWMSNGCNMRELAERMKISHSTLYEWLKQSTELAKAVNTGSENILAKAENIVRIKLDEGDPEMARFVLKNHRNSPYNQNTQKLEAEGIELKSDKGSTMNELLDALDGKQPPLTPSDGSKLTREQQLHLARELEKLANSMIVIDDDEEEIEYGNNNTMAEDICEEQIIDEFETVETIQEEVS